MMPFKRGRKSFEDHFGFGDAMTFVTFVFLLVLLNYLHRLNHHIVYS